MLNKLKTIRCDRGMQQKALADAANVSAPFLHDLENGNRNAKAETWQRIADALGCTVEELNGDEELFDREPAKE